MADHILVVDDDAGVRELLDDYLTTHGYQVTAVGDGVFMNAALAEHDIDLIILDLKLPGEDGFDLARRVRDNSSIPIIMLTGRNDETNRVVGLELGADDYVSKPFSPRELLARIGAVLRRTTGTIKTHPKADVESKVAAFLGWRLDITRRKLFSPEDREVRLTTGEFNTLFALVRNSNRVLNREQLLNYASKDSGEVFDRSVDIQIMRLRRKIEADPANPSIIKTERGAGYIFNEKVDWL
ncbi:MAG: response regulator [Rhodospirillales bacterium]